MEARITTRLRHAMHVLKALSMCGGKSGEIGGTWRDVTGATWRLGSHRDIDASVTLEVR